MPVFAYLLREWKFVSQQMGLCVFRAQLRLRTFYFYARKGKKEWRIKKVVGSLQLL